MQDKAIDKKSKQILMKEIEFKRTSNIFINSGIVSLYQYLKQCQEDNIFDYEYSFALDKNSLFVESDKLFTLLEDVYYFMGKELYDTSGKKAWENQYKYYFTKEPFSCTPFFKMKTYGLGALITNDPQPVPKEKQNAVTFENLTITDSEFAKAVAKVYREKDIKLKKFKIESLSISKLIEDGRKNLNKHITAGLELSQFIKKASDQEEILQKKLKALMDRAEFLEIFKQKDELINNLRTQIITAQEFIELMETIENLLLSKIDDVLKNEGFFKDEGENGDSRIFLNEPYIKTLLEKPKKEYFQEGNQVCYLTNESFQKLVDIQNTSPFIKGLTNFNSFLSPQSQKVSWKAMYLSRFSPKLNLYNYVSGLDSIICYFFDSNNLENLNTLYQQNRSMFKDSIQMIESNYMSNFKTHSFFNEGERFSEPNDYTGKNETLFALIYTFYKQFLYEKGFDDINDVENIFDLGFDRIPISLVSFKADMFSKTLRPSNFENFNNFKFVIRFIIYSEKNKIKFSEVLESLKFTSNGAPKDQNKRKQSIRIYREKILSRILSGKSIIKEMSDFYYKCFSYLVSGNAVSIKNVGYKNFQQLTQFTSKYELKINKKMTPEMQEKAFKLGTSIGMAITRFENPENKNDEKANAKSGRKYIIDLNKSRTLDQFNDAIIRIMNKYQLQVNSELFKENLNEENFEMVKQFAIIGALNVINNVIKPVNTNNNEKE
jgi:hypothetical protein